MLWCENFTFCDTLDATEHGAQLRDSDITWWRIINGQIYMLSLILLLLFIQNIAHKSITPALRHYGHVCPIVPIRPYTLGTLRTQKTDEIGRWQHE